MVGVARRTSLPRCAFAGNFPRHRGGLNSFEGRSSTAYTASRVQCSLCVCVSPLWMRKVAVRQLVCHGLRAQTRLLQGLRTLHSTVQALHLPRHLEAIVLSCMADMDTHTGCGELAFCPALGLLAVVTVARGELLTLSTPHKYHTKQAV